MCGLFFNEGTTCERSGPWTPQVGGGPGISQKSEVNMCDSDNKEAWSTVTKGPTARTLNEYIPEEQPKSTRKPNRFEAFKGEYTDEEIQMTEDAGCNAQCCKATPVNQDKT